MKPYTVTTNYHDHRSIIYIYNYVAINAGKNSLNYMLSASVWRILQINYCTNKFAPMQFRESMHFEYTL